MTTEQAASCPWNPPGKQEAEFARAVGLSVSAAQLSGSLLAGGLWETFVCGELRQALARAGSARQLHFWRDRTKDADVFDPGAVITRRGGRRPPC
jgi:hypothetical protein